MGPLTGKVAAPYGRYLNSAHDLSGGPMTKPSVSAVRDLHPNKPSRCSRCQHAEFVHAYAGPCLFHDCECPFFIPEAELDVEEAGGKGERPPALTSTFAPAYSRRGRVRRSRRRRRRTRRSSGAGTGSVGARKRHPSPVQHVVAARSETALHDAGGGTVVPVAHPPRLRLLGQGRIGRPRLGPRPQAPAVATTTTRPMARPSTTDHDGRSETPGR
jgi:hypothetical protein